MKAIVLHESGGPEKLSYEDVADPEPGPREVVVRLHAAALNRRDVFARQGLYPGASFPSIPGSDGSGEISNFGNEIDVFELANDVVILPSLYWGDDPRVPGPDFTILGNPTDGTYAQYVKVPAENVFPKPDHLLHGEAAAVPLCLLTAYRALVTRGGLQPGETVVVPGVGSGVATFLVQIAASLECSVFVISGSDEKIERAKEDLGAEGGVNYKSENWVRELRQMAGDVDLSVDGVGGEILPALTTLARPGGRIVSYGATAGTVPELLMPRIFLKSLDVLGTTMGTASEFEEALYFYERRGLKPLVKGTYDLEQAGEAQEYMESDEGMGKIVLRIP